MEDNNSVRKGISLKMKLGLVAAAVLLILGAVQLQNKQLWQLVNRQISKIRGGAHPQKPLPRGGILFSGISVNNGTHLAIINDKICRPGDEVEGYVITDIGDDTVVLQHKTDKQIINFSLYSEQEKRQLKDAKRASVS